MAFSDYVAVGVALAASAFDLHSRRIPNALTFSAALAGFFFATHSAGLPGAASSLTGWALGTALWLPLYALGGMGAGDVKLMAAIGAWLGPTDVFHATLYATVAGGLMALAVAIVRGCIRQTFVNIHLLVVHWQVAGFAPHAQLTLGSADSPRLAYALPVVAGTVVAIWLR